MDTLELELHRENTLAFIAYRPSTITLIPKTVRVRTASGGWTDADAPPRQPQTFRIIEQGARNQPPVIRTQDGKVRIVDFMLLGAFDATVEIDDSWTASDGRVWEIGDVIRDNGYEVRALVAERGR